MKSCGNLFDQVCDPKNLLLALRRAQRGKRARPDVAAFAFRGEGEVLRLAQELREGRYRPGGYRTFHITDPKPRLISAAPFRDRVVHHALCQVIEPVFERSFIYHSYACRKVKGTHAALDHFTRCARRFPWALKCDVSKFFPSLDHEILKALVCRRLREPALRSLVSLIVDSSCPQEEVTDYFPGDDLFTPFVRRKGLPIGNLTSQFFANVYLDPLDHFVQEMLRPGAYLRYCDDFALFDADPEALRAMKVSIASFLVSLRLQLHPRKCHLHPTAGGVDFLGYRVYPFHRRLRFESIVRFRRRARRLARAFAEGEVMADDITRSVQAWLAHALHGNTYSLRRRLLAEIAFRRG